MARQATKSRLRNFLFAHSTLQEAPAIDCLGLHDGACVDIRPGNPCANFGFFPILPHGHTGHLNLVVIAQLGRPPERWPVALFDEENGTASTVASSLTTWFPSFMVSWIGRWYPLILEGDAPDWAKEC